MSVRLLVRRRQCQLP